MTPIPGSCFPLVFLSPSLSGQMPTLAPGSCLPVSPSLCGQMPDVVSPACLPVSPSVCGQVASPACLPVSPSLRVHARCCCDAGSGVVFVSLCLSTLCGRLPDAVTPARGCLPVAPSLCGQMPDAVTLAPGLCLLQSLRSDARCCDAGSGVVSPAYLPVSGCDAGSGFVSPACLLMSLRSDARFCDAGSGRSDARCCDAGSGVVSPLVSLHLDAVRSDGRRLRCRDSRVPGCVSRLSQDARCCDAGSGVMSPACLSVSPSLCACLPLVPLRSDAKC